MACRAYPANSLDQEGHLVPGEAGGEFFMPPVVVTDAQINPRYRLAIEIKREELRLLEKWVKRSYGKYGFFHCLFLNNIFISGHCEP